MFDEKDYKIIQGDSLETIKQLADKSVDCCITSPPYYGLRDYGTGKWVGGDPTCPHKRLNKYSERTTTGHSQEELRGNVGDAIYKTVCPLCGAVRIDKQIGLEETPEQYIDKLVILFREVKRVLKDDGTLWVNIGDSYAGGAGRWGGTDSISEKQDSNKGSLSEINNHKKWVHSEIKQKDLIGIPWMLAFALRADGWYLRQDIIWHKLNPMPESVADRCTKSHEYIFLLSKNQNYYFDYEAIEEQANYDGRKDTLLKGSNKYASDTYLPNNNPQSFASSAHERWKFKEDQTHNVIKAVRRKRDVWSVCPSQFKEAHFATFPEELVEPMVSAGCRVGGTVLDVFSGSGTTGVVALKQGKRYIGLELNKEYVDLSIKRIEESIGNIVIDSKKEEKREIIGEVNLWTEKH